MVLIRFRHDSNVGAPSAVDACGSAARGREVLGDAAVAIGEDRGARARVQIVERGVVVQKLANVADAARAGVATSSQKRT